ncbi:MAG: tRNA (adenosine(37)-N6)-dimethylallyltransferase MiaA [Minisyncoccia bacterium]|jgi:tRNA dimethylallyltransferase
MVGKDPKGDRGAVALKMPKIVAVVGPTASGKTALAIAIARRFDGEIVSADSRQVYRGMDIGTAKPTRTEMRAAPHHLIDIKNPDEEYAVAEYKEDALLAIRDILARKKLPIVIGGTGLYVKAVLENLDIPKIKANPALRERLEREIKERGLPAVFDKLVALDPEAAYVVDPKNPRRIVRALEVALTTGIPFTAQRKKNEPLFDALVIGLNPPPDILRKRIDARVDRMVRDGLVKETEQLVKKYGADCQALDAIGYREIIDYLQKKHSLPETVALIKTNTWHYAKRQLTWFRKDKTVRWMRGKSKTFAAIKKWLGDPRAPHRPGATSSAARKVP